MTLDHKSCSGSSWMQEVNQRYSTVHYGIVLPTLKYKKRNKIALNIFETQKLIA